jgi:PAS domain S-box-containing protein
MTVTQLNYELYFDLSPDLLCIAGYDGYFKKINKAVSRLLGYSFEELYTTPINDFVYKDDQDVTDQVRKELTQSKPLYNFENRYLTKSGDIVWLTWTSFPIEEDQVIFAIAKDITHKKQLEVERNQVLSNLTTLNKDLRQLSYTTSHDLRTPVAGLISVLRLLDLSRIRDQETLELVEILRLAGESLNQTLNNYAAILNKRKEEERVEVTSLDLRKHLDNVKRSIRYLVQTSQTTIFSDFSALPFIDFDAAYLESIFLNLITNSIKYSRPDRLPMIRIYSRKEAGHKQLIFSDNGIGFDMEKVKGKIFGLHQKFHDHPDSNGVGLYLVHSYITSLGGKIRIESSPNQGATFIMDLP